MYKALIVDDEDDTIEIFQIFLAPLSHEISIMGACNNIRNALVAIKDQQPDILFLDIELADGLGFEILEQMPDLKAKLIFVTAYDHYAIKAIKFHAFDYILKPIMKEELHEAVHKAIADIENKTEAPDNNSLIAHLKDKMSQKIAVPSKNGLHYHLIEDIVAIEGDGSYATMHFANGKSTIISRIVKDFEEVLVEKGFLRVHKSYLINVNHISELRRDDSGYFIMSSGKKIPVSFKEKEDLFQKLRQASIVI